MDEFFKILFLASLLRNNKIKSDKEFISFESFDEDEDEEDDDWDLDFDD